MKMSEYGVVGVGVDNGGDEDRVTEWEVGLPSVDDLTPLSQSLIPPELASAFSISPEPNRTSNEVNRASQTTLSSLLGVHHSNPTTKGLFYEDPDPEPMVVEADENENMMITDRNGSGSDPKRSRGNEFCLEEADSALHNEDANDDPSSARTLKRQRLVWTPQLHKRFVDVVGHLGIKNAVPKTIMQLMNVEGLTRENVASHLQKYRLYLKRMSGGGGSAAISDGPSSNSTSTSDHLFASVAPHVPIHVPMMHMPMGHPYNMGMPMGHPYNMFHQQQHQPGNISYQYGSQVAPNEN
jgi:SHAQKYF class myb-like DNA-binding protein